MRKITVIEGDGIGKEVMNSAISVLDSLDLNWEYKTAEAGYECFQKNGTNLPSETIKTSKKTDATLFGAVTTVPGQKSAIVTLRKELDLFANIRPIKSLPGTNSLYNDLDFVIIRENTEGLYSGLEEFTSEGAIATRLITKQASLRICKFAFEYAKKNKRDKVTAVHKANVLRKTDGVFKDSFYKTSLNYSKIESNDFYVDATAMYLITEPHIFDVIVTSNLFGDILSDEGAGLVGGLGMIPSANIGDNNGLFEPVHGSAPDIEGKGIANPSGMLLSTVMMLNHLGETEKATITEKAMLNVLKEGRFLTPDLGGSSTTQEMTEAIIRNLNM